MKSKQILLRHSTTGSPSLDSFSDLVANKMVTLVEQGTTHDFLDIYTLCYEGLVTASQCWQLWQGQQQLNGGDMETAQVKLAVQAHVARIAQQQPVEKISDPKARAATAQLRTWFSTEFLQPLS